METVKLLLALSLLISPYCLSQALEAKQNISGHDNACDGDLKITCQEIETLTLRKAGAWHCNHGWEEEERALILAGLGLACLSYIRSHPWGQGTTHCEVKLMLIQPQSCPNSDLSNRPYSRFALDVVKSSQLAPNRSVPQLRDPACGKLPPLQEPLPSVAVIITFR